MHRVSLHAKGTQKSRISWGSVPRTGHKYSDPFLHIQEEAGSPSFNNRSRTPPGSKGADDVSSGCSVCRWTVTEERSNGREKERAEGAKEAKELKCYGTWWTWWGVTTQWSHQPICAGGTALSMLWPPRWCKFLFWHLGLVTKGCSCSTLSLSWTGISKTLILYPTCWERKRQPTALNTGDLM